MPQPRESVPSPYQFGEDASGITPATGTPSGRFLRDDGTWQAVQGGGSTSVFTSSADGLVPMTGGSALTTFLRADGTWVVPTDTTYSAFSGGVTGLVPSSDNGTTTFLRADGTFATPSDDAKADKVYVDSVDATIVSGVVLKAVPVVVTASHFFTGGLSFSSVAPTTSVTPSSANDITNKSYVDSVTAGPKTFLAIGSSTSSIANATRDLTWATPEISDSDISLSSNELTFAVAGGYSIDVTARVTGTGRVEATIKTFKDTGSGYSELTDHISSNDSLRDSNQDTGSTVLNTMLTLAAGDKLKFQVTGDTLDGVSATLMTAGTILRIVGYT